MMWAETEGMTLDEVGWRAFVEERSLHLTAPDEAGTRIVARSEAIGVA